MSVFLCDIYDQIYLYVGKVIYTTVKIVLFY